MKMLACEKLAAGYGRRAVVRVEDFAALKGQLICFLGPNGAGKSTLLKTLAGYLSPLSGVVYLKEHELWCLDRRVRAETMAVLLTERVAPELLSVFEVVALGRHPYTDLWGRLSPADEAKVRRALRLVGAEGLAGRFYGELSDGEKQKVLLARALAQEPEVIVLDEPTTHLDLQHRAEIMRVLARLCREEGITVLLSLHEVDLALKAAAYVVLVKDGTILAAGFPEEVLTPEAVAALYNLEAGSFDPVLGGAETGAAPDGPLVFVVAGGGSGALLYRALAKRGFALATGVLPANDVDAFVARAFGARLFTVPPFASVGGAAVAQALELTARAVAVVDAGFPVTAETKGNLELLAAVAGNGCPVFSLRRDGGPYGRAVPSLGALLAALNRRFSV